MNRSVLALVLALLGSAVPAQTLFASRVAEFRPGAGGGVYPPSNALGAPEGQGLHAGSLHILDLGLEGSLTLGFDVELCDGPGADFIVFENAFYMAGTLDAWAELAFVEVSTDGLHFARFPALFAGGPGLLPMGSARNLAGIGPVHAHPVLRPWIDPRDPCQAGGDAFDLADLRGDPLVLGNLVDLSRIRFVRIVDIASGKERDPRGRVILDSGSGADIDAVAVIHHRGNQAPRGPRVDLAVGGAQMRLTVSDPDGIPDLAEVRASLLGIEVDPAALLGVFRVVRATPNLVEFILSGYPPGLPFALGFSVRDRSGAFSAAVRPALE